VKPARRVHCDILIIGSGAAGGVLAATLSEFTDNRIILVERGGHFGSASFDQRELDMLRLYADRGGRSTFDGAIPVQGGQCVGGGTTINYALSFDPIEAVWAGWRKEHGLKGLSFYRFAGDYDVKDLNISHCTAEVRRRINVRRVAEEHVNDNNRVFESGCRRLGVPTKHFELNMRDCIGCGYCGQGCAYDRKQGTMITYIADALARGVRLIHHCEITAIDFSSSNGVVTATGAAGEVHSTEPGSKPNSIAPGPIRISAKLVIVTSGAIESPSLLQRSGYPDPHDTVGRGLVLHPSLPIAGLFDRELRNYRGVTGSVYSDAYYQRDGFYYECLFDHPVNAAIAIPRIGKEHFETMLRYRNLAGFGVMLVDSVASSNRVTWNPATVKADIVYRLSENDKSRLRFAARTGVEIMFAAGAEEVFLTSEEPIGPLAYPRFKSAAEAAFCSELMFKPGATLLTSAHCQATAKMGEDPASSVVDSRCEAHNAKHLIVCDSSSFPTSCGANPMVSIMTLARYQGRRIAAERSRYGL
jgi:choline dehydrogenase-like flavoprotein